MQKHSFLENVVGVFALIFTSIWASLLIISTILFALKFPISELNLLASLLTTSIFIFWYVKKTVSKMHFFVVIAASFLFITTFLPLNYLVSKVYDISYDGQAYHQEAIIQLSRGWNPIYMILTDEATANLERWLNHYPKGVWIPAATLYKATGNIESGKIFAVYSLVMAFTFSLWGMWKMKFISWVNKVAVSLLLAFNPVVIYQSLSFYVDGIMVSLLLSIAFICVKIIYEKDKNLFLPLMLIILISVNIKLTSAVFTVLLTGVFIFYLWINDKLRLALELSKRILVSLAIGILIIGYNPYVTNLALKGHPLYPAMGRGALDYTPLNMPQNYWGLSSPERLFMSIFSVSSHARGEGQFGKLKIPFSVYPDELNAFRETNTKTGGFGPLFGGVLILSIPMIFLIKDKKLLLGMFITILGSASLISISNVARFVPYVWWFPPLTAFFLLKTPNFFAKLGGSIIALILLINSFLVSYSYFPYNITQSTKLERQLAELSRYDKTLLVDVGLFGSTKIKLRSHKIAYLEASSNSPCTKRQRFLVSNVSEICELN